MMRILRHLCATQYALARRFGPADLDAIEFAIRTSEARHRAEICFCIEAGLDLPTLWRCRTPRARALEVFTHLEVWDTVERNGVLIYLLLADRDVEIVADRGLDDLIGASDWQRVCRICEDAFRAERWREGALRGIDATMDLLCREYPLEPGGGADELPNRPVVL